MPTTAHAIPQLYVEAGYGDLSVKAGHFYTIIGYEVVQATGNFFYSHAYTFNFSEPFTHTGVLATYNASDDVTDLGWLHAWVGTAVSTTTVTPGWVELRSV